MMWSFQSRAFSVHLVDRLPLLLPVKRWPGPATLSKEVNLLTCITLLIKSRTFVLFCHMIITITTVSNKLWCYCAVWCQLELVSVSSLSSCDLICIYSCDKGMWWHLCFIMIFSHLTDLTYLNGLSEQQITHSKCPKYQISSVRAWEHYKSSY